MSITTATGIDPLLKLALRISYFVQTKNVRALALPHGIIEKSLNTFIHVPGVSI
jgi:hypothetical protein